MHADLRFYQQFWAHQAGTWWRALGLALALAAGLFASPNGRAATAIDGSSAATAFTALGMAANVTTAGIYYFNVGGQTYSTYVNSQGFVQIAIDFGGAAVANLPQGTALTTASRGILTPAVLATMTGLSSLKITSSDGNISVTTTNATLLSRIASNTTLGQGSGDNTLNATWNGTGAATFTGGASCITQYATTLNANIWHGCGNVTDFHWIPIAGYHKEIWNSGEVAATVYFQLWVKAPAVPIPPNLTVSKTSLNGTGNFAFTGTNGLSPLTVTTAVSGVAVAATKQGLTTASVVTTVSESLPTGYSLTGVTCSGMGAGGNATANLAAGSVTLDALATAANTNIACTFTNTLRQAQLSISKTDGTSSVTAGGTTVYTVTVSNAGPFAADGAVVRDTADAGLTCTAATCSATGSPSAVCPSAATPQALMTNLASGIAIPTLPAASTVSFSVSCGIVASGH